MLAKYLYIVCPLSLLHNELEWLPPGCTSWMTIKVPLTLVDSVFFGSDIPKDSLKWKSEFMWAT